LIEARDVFSGGRRLRKDMKDIKKKIKQGLTDTLKMVWCIQVK